MNTKALSDVLTTHGPGTDKDGTIELSEDTSVSLYAGIGSESLVISSVSGVTLSTDMVLATTRKGESFALLAEDIRAVRFGKAPSKKKTGLI